MKHVRNAASFHSTAQKTSGNLTTTSIAAVIAVTILHSDNVSPEEKLLEIIEASGEAEVLDADDAAAEFETFQDEILPVATNDNSIATVSE